MGAAASIQGATSTTSNVEGNNFDLAMATDLALRDALRQLQLSPDTIDKAAAAVYAHARDPIQHPVDKDLPRLCTSEFTRGALHALSWYLAAISTAANGIEISAGIGLSTTVVGAETAVVSEKLAHGEGAAREGTLLVYEGRKSGGPTPSVVAAAPGADGNTMSDSTTGRLATIWNRLRRTRSMPSREGGVTMLSSTGAGTDGELLGVASSVQVASPRGKGALASDDGSDIPTLGVRVNTIPRGAKGTSLLAGLGLGSPRSSSMAASGKATPRRAPVRTGHWKLGHEIGKGSFGAVHIGLNEDSGDLIAVKVLSLQNADAAESLYREIELMRHLTHPNIVCYLGAEVNDSEKTVSIFQEWVPGSVTTLLVNFGPFSDRRIAGYTKQILQGLAYLHKERVIHRDIKGGNILIDDRGVVKLCDFGASKMLDAESFMDMSDHTRVGSPLFMAPEILLRHDYGPQVDIWSLGGAVLEMATGQPPWHTLNLRTPVALINWVKCTEGPPPLPESLSQPLHKFLLRCFERDPNKRATAKQLLNDPFVAKRQGQVLKSSASDADSISDIDNLSRTAAIARMRRASCSDCSAPSSAASGSSCASGVRAGSRSPGGGRGGGGGGTFAGVMQKAADGREELPGKSGATPSRQRLAVQREIAPELRVVTSGLEPSASPRIITPPTRRVSAGRGGSASPNPFGGRRRSFENSPDSSRSPRCGAVSPAMSVARRQVAEQEERVGNDDDPDAGYSRDGGVGGGGNCSGERGRGRGRVARDAPESSLTEENVETVVMRSVNTKRGSSAASILRRSDSGRSRSSSSRSSSSDGSKRESLCEDTPRAPLASQDASSKAARAALKRRRSGRGERPGGGAGDSPGDAKLGESHRDSR